MIIALFFFYFTFSFVFCSGVVHFINTYTFPHHIVHFSPTVSTSSKSYWHEILLYMPTYNFSFFILDELIFCFIACTIYYYFNWRCGQLSDTSIDRIAGEDMEKFKFLIGLRTIYISIKEQRTT